MESGLAENRTDRGYHHHALLLLNNGLWGGIRVLSTSRLRSSRWAFWWLIAIRSASKIHLIKLASIAAEPKLYSGAGRPWNFVTEDIQTLSINVLGIDELQDVTWLDTTALICGASLHQAFDVNQHAPATRVDSFPAVCLHCKSRDLLCNKIAMQDHELSYAEKVITPELNPNSPKLRAISHGSGNWHLLLRLSVSWDINHLHCSSGDGGCYGLIMLYSLHWLHWLLHWLCRI